MHFTIAKADAEQGFISTNPLRAGQSFELWRSDNTSQLALAEANLHTIRRTAELTVSESSGRQCALCEVRVERMSLPEHEVVGAGGAARMFTKSRGSLQRLKLNPSQEAPMTWIDLGRDAALETEILSRLKQKLAYQ